MDAFFIILLGWIGIYGPVALASLGSAIGCTRAGKAAFGAMLEVDGGYGRYIGLAVLHLWHCHHVHAQSICNGSDLTRPVRCRGADRGGPALPRYPARGMLCWRDQR